MARSYAALAMAVYILSQEPSENFEPEAVVVKPRKVFAKKIFSRILRFSRPLHDSRMFFSTAASTFSCFPLAWPIHSQRKLEPVIQCHCYDMSMTLFTSNPCS